MIDKCGSSLLYSYGTGYTFERAGDEMANIRDVAKEAGLSIATVSRYLNKKGYVSQASATVIEEAVRTLNYKPSLVARSLSTKQTNYIGLLVPDIMNPFFPELARAVEDIALTYDYTVVLCNSDDDPKKERHYIDTLKQKYIAGFIISTSALDASHYEDLDVPIVALDRKTYRTLPSVSSDNHKGAKIGTNYLIERGCKHIICLRGPKGIGPADERLAGFLEATAGQNIKSQIVDCHFQFEVAEKVTREILQNDPSIDGIFASSDVSAAGALKAAHSLGIKVPDDLQIIGFDNINLSEMMTPGLTTIAQDIYKMGAVAARMLIKMIENLPIEQKTVQIPIELIKRGTTRSEDK